VQLTQRYLARLRTFRAQRGEFLRGPLARIVGKAGEDVLEAGRGEVYAGQYEVSDERATMIDERLIKLDSLAATDGGPALVTPEKSIAETLAAKGVRAVEVGAATTTSDVKAG